MTLPNDHITVLMLRALVTFVSAISTSNPGKLVTTCPKCKAALKLGQAIQQTRTPASEDFPGSGIVTMNPGGPGSLIPAMKCPECGWSRTIAKEDN